MSRPGRRASRADSKGDSAAFPPTTAWAVSPRADWIAASLLAGFLVAVGWVVLARHPTPLYEVETDLVGEYIPAARSLRAGEFRPEQYSSKGIGYPLALAATSRLTGADDYLAARLLNLASSAVGAAFGYVLVSRLLGGGVGLLMLIGLLLNPHFLQAAVEAGSDMPTFALAIAATALLLPGAGRAGAPAPRHSGRAWRWSAVGLIAGLAVITRFNTIFLAPAAAVALAFGRRRLRRALLWSAGFSVPVAAWAVAGRAVPGGLVGAQNVMNVAYEFYGGGMNPELFWGQAAGRFRSLVDVVALDPWRFAAHLGINLVTRWRLDFSQLLSPWMGVPALIGLPLAWWRRPGWAPLWAHFLLCSALLATVFYLPRFALYLLPIYLSAAAWLVLEGRVPGRWGARLRWFGARRSPGETVARLTLWGLLVLPVGWSAVSGVSARLAAAPHEVRLGGEVLRLRGPRGAGVMARKPHVAHFADMRYVPIPSVLGFADLLSGAAASGSEYLFVSPVEIGARPQFRALMDSAVSLPGLRQVAHRVIDARRFYAVYRFTGERPSKESLDRAVLAMARRFAADHPRDPMAQLFAAGQLLGMGLAAEAISHLEVAERLSPGDVRIARLQVLALSAMRSYDRAAAVLDRLMRDGPATAWGYGQLGVVRMAQSRIGEARELFERAVRLEPANPEYRRSLALADSLLRR